MSRTTLPVRPRRLRRVVAATAFGVVLVGAGLGYASDARADGVLSNVEWAYVQAYGVSAVCPTIDLFPTESGVMGVVAGIAEDGFTGDSAVDIINESVASFCPRHWPLLQAIGAKYRGETDGGYVV